MDKALFSKQGQKKKKIQKSLKKHEEIDYAK